jgi:hypothetical protein
MVKSCPPGVFCIENSTIFFLFVVAFMLVYVIFFKSNGNSMSTSGSGAIPGLMTRPMNTQNSSFWGDLGGGLSNFMVRMNQNFGSNSVPKDVLLNPYAPPLSNDNYFPNLMPSLGLGLGLGPEPTRDVRGPVSMVPPGQIPINVRTQGAEGPFRQVGILTSTNSQQLILPLMGRPILSNRDKWQYYSMTENNNIKIPVSRGNRSCMNEYGCDKIYDGDNVYVSGYKNVFQATIYDNDIMRYLPFY